MIGSITSFVHPRLCGRIYVYWRAKSIRDAIYLIISKAAMMYGAITLMTREGGRRSPAVACWASDHWVASSNPLRGKFRH